MKRSIERKLAAASASVNSVVTGASVFDDKTLGPPFLELLELSRRNVELVNRIKNELDRIIDMSMTMQNKQEGNKLKSAFVFLRGQLANINTVNHGRQ